MSAVIFDLDGTLVDSAPAVTQKINQALVAHGYAEAELSVVRNMLTYEARDLVS